MSLWAPCILTLSLPPFTRVTAVVVCSSNPTAIPQPKLRCAVATHLCGPLLDGQLQYVPAKGQFLFSYWVCSEHFGLFPCITIPLSIHEGSSKNLHAKNMLKYYWYMRFLLPLMMLNFQIFCDVFIFIKWYFSKEECINIKIISDPNKPFIFFFMLWLISDKWPILVYINC